MSSNSVFACNCFGISGNRERIFGLWGYIGNFTYSGMYSMWFLDLK